jgi:glutaminase
MVNGMANRETSGLGGEGVAVCPEYLISWVFTPVLGERGVIVKGGFHYCLSD